MSSLRQSGRDPERTVAGPPLEVSVVTEFRALPLSEKCQTTANQVEADANITKGDGEEKIIQVMEMNRNEMIKFS